MLETLGMVLDIVQIVLMGIIVVLLYKRAKEDDNEE